MSLFAELRRRNVFRIGFAYLVVAWLLMQVAALAVPALLLPDWVTTFVVFLLALGFPVALLLAWAYEMTPEGVKKIGDIPAAERGLGPNNRKVDFIVIGLLGIAVVALLFDRINSSPTDVSTAVSLAPLVSSVDSSIAVLPFVNMSGDPNQEHFVDGLTEELLNSLVGIQDLRVISRTSSFSFKNQSVPLDEIAKRLGVSHILEGSVRRAGDRIRVTAQLIETETDAHLWSETYNRELTVDNILNIQEDVANTVVRALRSRLSVEGDLVLQRDGPSTMAALDLYHDGMYFLRQIEISVSEGDAPYELAAEKFEASIDLDDNWAPAHAGLGRVYHFWKDVGDRDEKLRISRQHILRAIELDNQYGLAYASLGYINTVEGDYAGAIAAYERADALGAETSWGKAILMGTLGRFEDAVVEYREASTRDPLSIAVKQQLAAVLYCAARYDELVVVVDRLLASVPDVRVAKLEFATALLNTGNLTRGMQLAEEIAAEEGSDVPIANILALAGYADRALAAIERGNTYDWWWTRAPAAVTLGRPELAMDILEQAEREGAGSLPGVLCDPETRSLSGNPRYDALVERQELLE